MKKIISALLAATLLLLAGCGSDKNNATTVATTSAPKSADMLNITSKSRNYSDSVKRYYAVLEAVKNKTQILEKEHNKQIEAENPDKYFLDENYIMTAFDPFILTDFSLTENFSANLTKAEVDETFAFKANGAEIIFENNGENSYRLSLVDEISLREYSVDYNTKDSFHYVLTTESSETTVVNEMLEFGNNANTYFIQSKTSRLFVQFDNNGNIVYFCCSTLKNGSYGNSESIYPDASPAKEWVTERNKDDYMSIYTYENGILTHEDSSSGPWKTFTIYESEFQNAFPLQ